MFTLEDFSKKPDKVPSKEDFMVPSYDEKNALKKQKCVYKNMLKNSFGRSWRVGKDAGDL